jgi:DNA-binding CsgD family transcriptional regulator
MPELLKSAVVLAAETNRISSTPVGSPRDWMSLWAPLQEILPFSAAWLGVLDTSGRRFLTAAIDGVSPPAREYFESPAYFANVDSSGVLRGDSPRYLRNHERPPTPFRDRLWWPAAQHDGLGVPLIATDGRLVGLLVLITEAIGQPGAAACEMIGEVAPLIAATIDPMASVIGLAGLVVGAFASAAIEPGGTTHPLPGSPSHPLLATGSPEVVIARDRLRGHRNHTAFLCPNPGAGPDEYLRLTAIACPPIPSSPFAGLVVVSPAGELHGLTRRELEVLGMVIDGATNRQIASALFIAQRTVAAHLEHILSKLDTPSRTAAAVRSLDLGLYIPCQLAGTGT